MYKVYRSTTRHGKESERENQSTGERRGTLPFVTNVEKELERESREGQIG